LRDKIGFLWDGESLLSEDLKKINTSDLMNKYIYNISNSDKVSASFINDLIRKNN